MSSIIKIIDDDRVDGRSRDSIKYNKHCFDFICLNDGTTIGESRYCNLSQSCRQVDQSVDGQTLPMESHYLPMIGLDGELCHDLFCTGMWDLRPYKERIEDDKVS